MLYLALLLTLVFDYGNPFTDQALGSHIEPFTYIFILWMLIFYIAGLYEIQHLKNSQIFLQRLGTVIIINGIIAMTIFYLFPFKITPKTNLLIFILSFGILEYIWRYIYNYILSASIPLTHILLIGSGKKIEEIHERVKNNPQLGYQINFWIKNDKIGEEELNHISQIIISEKINLIVIPSHLKKDSKTAKVIYRNLVLGIETLDFASFYEIVFGKVPIEELEEVWFLENLVNRHKIYELIKEPLEITAALVLALIISPILALISLLIKMTSAGPIIYKQKRVGQYGAEFVLYKFRTMVKDAEKGGVQWAQLKDLRTTFFGKILRHTHLDELPQLFNVVKGDISFVGPRPERPEFTKQLRETIPHYDLRHLTRPGITGWAQLNYRYGASVEDAKEKLQYDIYYIKNRSFWLDLSIVVKTIKMFLISNK